MRILVVEDDPKLAQLLQRGLKEKGYAVDLASNGDEGLDFALATQYDAIILDVMLPQKDGFQVLSQLRRKNIKTPILVLTALSGVDKKIQGLDLGADDYLPKPFDFKELEARLRALLRRPAVEPQSLLKLGDLEMDVTRHEVRRGRKIIELSAKEFSLLEYLLRKKGVVVTRAMIQNHVWNFDYEGGTNLVEVYINYLRRKIDENFSPKLIHTIRGSGYVLKEGG